MNRYELKIDFEKNSKNASNIFYSMGKAIDTFKYIDNTLISVISQKYSYEFLLEDIEKGSLRAIIKTILNLFDDEALKEGSIKKLIGMFLFNSKYKLLEWIEKKDRLDSLQEIEDKTQEINCLAEEVNVNLIPNYKELKPIKIIKCINSLSKATNYLPNKDNLFYIANDKIIRLNKNIIISPNILNELQDIQENRFTQKTFLAIKKPDYLGHSRWEFKMPNGHRIEAKILDNDWLNSFKERHFEIKPGDALNVLLETNSVYNPEKEKFEEVHNILEIYGIQFPEEEEPPEAPELFK